MPLRGPSALGCDLDVIGSLIGVKNKHSSSNITHDTLPARLANDHWFHLRADQPHTLAVISATRRPNARAMARSSGLGCSSPCPPAMVVAPYGVPPRASVWSIPSTE